MTDKELKKLRRNDLLELLIKQMESNEQLQSQHDVLNAKLQSREINLETPGSIYDTVAQVSEVFRNADQIAEQYLENTRLLTERQTELCRKMERECREHCEKTVAEAERDCEESKQAAERYWAELSEKLENFYQEHLKLRAMICGSNAVISPRKEAGVNE